MAHLHQLVVFFYLVFVLSMLRPVYSDCDSDSGPTGGVDCLTIARYSGPQWGTCLTDQYIEQNSKGHHQCEDRTATYCYYQCMLESHNINSGDVVDECSCSLDSTQRTTLSPLDLTSLDPACYSPNGADCNWYRNCLEKKFHCSETTDDYGIAFAEKFCNLYTESYQRFSTRAQQWVDAVRKCLQVQLAPLLRPFEHVTCADIRERAFRSHADCYIQPYRGSVSICSLSCFDLVQIFWTIKSAFVDAFQESLYGMLQVAKSCIPRNPCFYGTVLETQKLVIRLVLPLRNLLTRVKRDAENWVPPILHEAAAADSSKPFDIENKNAFRDSEYSRSAATTAKENLNRFHKAKVKKTATDILQRSKRQVPSETWTGETTLELAYHKAASQAAQSMANQLGWGSSGVMWFAYGQQIDNTSMDVHILLADKYTYGLNETVDGTAEPNMTLVVDEAAEAIQENRIDFQVNGERVSAVSLCACVDLECQQVFLNVTAQLTNTAVRRMTRFTTDLLVVMVVWWVGKV